MPPSSHDIIRVAQLDMTRNALGHWEKFKIPPHDPHFDTLLANLAPTPAHKRAKRSFRALALRRAG